MNQFKLALVITLCLSPLSWSPLSATAQVVESQVSTTKKQVKFIQQLFSVDLTGRGAPDSGSRRTSGGSRGCVGGNKLTALVPLTEDSQGKEYVFGTTTAEYPTFWFYIGYELATEIRITFVLADKQDNEIYRATALTKDTTPGIFSLRPTEIPLEVGKIYHWYFYVDCNPTDSSEPFPVVNGWVERVTLEETASLTGTAIEQAVVYGREGVWYDALTIVGEQLQANPQDARIQAEWTGLLQDIDLIEIPSEPIEALKLEREDL